MAIEAVLLDSGGVLMGPKGGRWNPRSDFEDNLREHHAVDGVALTAAIAVGDAWLATPAAISAPYGDYYRQILGALAIEATDDLLSALLPDRDPSTFLETYPEVLDVIAELRGRGVRLAVVSDAWPDLPRLHEALGMVDCFELYAISGVLGWTKPDPRLFRHASDSLGLSPGECLFVDDSVELVEAAAALGYRAVVMRRGGEPVPHHVRAISSLHGVLDLLGP